MEICVVKFSKDLPCLNLTEGDLLFDIGKHHHKVFALLVYAVSLLTMVTTALLSSMIMAGNYRGLSWFVCSFPGFGTSFSER